jgi:hypothetical protein
MNRAKAGRLCILRAPCSDEGQRSARDGRLAREKVANRQLDMSSNFVAPYWTSILNKGDSHMTIDTVGAVVEIVRAIIDLITYLRRKIAVISQKSKRS